MPSIITPWNTYGAADELDELVAEGQAMAARHACAAAEYRDSREYQAAGFSLTYMHEEAVQHQRIAADLSAGCRRLLNIA